MFFAIILVTHVTDILIRYNNFNNRSLAVHIPFFTWYLFIALVLAPALLDNGEGFAATFFSSRVFVFIGVSLIAALLPWLLSLFGAKILGVLNDSFMFNWLLIFTPPWLVFLIFANEHSSVVDGVRKVWLIIWIILLLATAFSMLGKMRLGGVLPTGSGGLDLNPLRTLGEAWERVEEALSNILKSILGIRTQAQLFLTKNLNDSLGINYMGQVDPYANQDLGVRFTELRSFSTRYFVGDEVIVHADIHGEHFQDEVKMNLVCFALDGQGVRHDGEIYAQGRDDGQISLEMRETVYASCTFNNLPVGYYNVWFKGSFVFETWAYIQYYFAPDELIKNAWQQNIDPAEDAGIPSEPIGIYTGGPIELGLASPRSQPIGIDPSNPSRTLPVFGASIMNLWPDGKVSSVRHITLMVPQPFILKGCDRPDANGRRGKSAADALIPATNRMPGYNEYTFGDINNPNLFFESVTCYLAFEGETYNNQVSAAQTAAAARLIGGYDLVVKTFAAKTNYVYSIQDSLQVQVESLENGVLR